MKDYLNRLSIELDNVNAKHKDDILDKYRKRYEFGLESGLSKKDIEEMLGDPKEIAERYRSEDPYTEEGYNKNYNMNIKTVCDDIVIKKGKDKKVHIIFDDVNPDNYTVKNNSDGILIEYPKTKYFSFNRKKGGTIIIEIPDGRLFYNAEVATSSGDIKIDYLNASKIELIVATADMVVHKLKGDKIKLTTVSGDIFIDKAECNDFVASAVSGDIEGNKIESNTLFIDTISGDAKIKEANGKLKTSSVSGDIYVNGVGCGSVKNYVRGIFKK